jgi:DNA-binding transcriptional LysR family regulator
MSDDFHDIRLRDLRFFDRLAALGTITAAAEELRLPKATASRWLAKLEERVDASLVKRTTHGVTLTEAGEEFAARARQLLSAAHAARLAVHSDVPAGLLRVSVPVPMGRMLAGPVIARFRRRLPSVRLEIRLENARVDLVKEGIDLAIRGGALNDSDMLTRKLSAPSMWLYMSARFRGERLAEIPLIASPGDERLLRRADVSHPGEPAVIVDDRTAVADALVWGAGVGLLPSFLGEPPREEGALCRYDDEPIVALPVHAIYHPSQRDDPRLQVLIDEIGVQLEEML